MFMGLCVCVWIRLNRQWVNIHLQTCATQEPELVEHILESEFIFDFIFYTWFED
jgi:hypothetical protein